MSVTNYVRRILEGNSWEASQPTRMSGQVDVSREFGQEVLPQHRLTVGWFPSRKCHTTIRQHFPEGEKKNSLGPALLYSMLKTPLAAPASHISPCSYT